MEGRGRERKERKREEGEEIEGRRRCESERGTQGYRERDCVCVVCASVFVRPREGETFGHSKRICCIHV